MDEITKLKDELSAAQSEIAQLKEELKRAEYWQGEKDKEVDTERVFVAVAEVESELKSKYEELEAALAEKVKKGVEAIWERDYFKNEVIKLKQEKEEFREINKEMVDKLEDCRLMFIRGDEGLTTEMFYAKLTEIEALISKSKDLITKQQ